MKLLYRVVTRYSLALSFLAANAVQCDAQSPDEYKPEMMQAFFKQEVSNYKISIRGDARQLTLGQDPLLHWTNPERMLGQGGFFVWYDGERPLVVTAVFSYQNKEQLKHRHELISLCDKPLKVEFDGEAVWVPEPADTKGRQIDDVGAPAENPARRLTQMRAIAREFVGRLYPAGDKTPIVLKLLPQPLCRYSSPKDNIVDGAIFAMSMVTDPEILVQLEARGKGGDANWFLVVYRSNYLQLELDYKGASIWKVPEVNALSRTKPMDMPYATKSFFVVTPKSVIPPPSSFEKK